MTYDSTWFQSCTCIRCDLIPTLVHLMHHPECRGRPLQIERLPPASESLQRLYQKSIFLVSHDPTQQTAFKLFLPLCMVVLEVLRSLRFRRCGMCGWTTTTVAQHGSLKCPFHKPQEGGPLNTHLERCRKRRGLTGKVRCCLSRSVDSL